MLAHAIAYQVTRWHPAAAFGIENRKIIGSQVLVQGWPDAVSEQDQHGYLPLHHACEYDGADDVIRFLVRSCPDSCQVPTKDGQLPLHLACGRKSPAVIYPHAVRFKDKSLQLPLHIACMRESACASEVMERFVRRWPESVRIPCLYDAENVFLK